MEGKGVRLRLIMTCRKDIGEHSLLPEYLAVIIFLTHTVTHRKFQIEGGNAGRPVEKATALIADILEQQKPRAKYIVAKNIMTLLKENPKE
jgi:hypothetical protein